MSVGKHKLNDKKVELHSKPGYLNDGGNLYAQFRRRVLKRKPNVKLKPAEYLTRSWIFRYRHRVTGKTIDLGLGSYPDVSLKEARVEADKQRDLLIAGKDPMEERIAIRAARKAGPAGKMTFDKAVEAYIASNKAGWKNQKHEDQWTNTLATYASPVIGDKLVSEIDVDLVLKVLNPIWKIKIETASRVRQRVEAVLSWATVMNHRSGANPARWRGHLDQVLPKPSNVRKPKHFPALAHKQIGGFMSILRAQVGLGAIALEFTILTAARTKMTIGATWKEFDLNEMLWTVPAERMKAKVEFIIPLSARVVEIVRQLENAKVNDFVFPGNKRNSPLSTAAMDATLERMGRKDITVHGFRSTFRDWANEATSYPHEAKESALAHQIQDKAEKAYSRTNWLEKRITMMEEWALYCSVPLVQKVDSPEGSTQEVKLQSKASTTSTKVVKAPIKKSRM